MVVHLTFKFMSIIKLAIRDKKNNILIRIFNKELTLIYCNSTQFFKWKEKCNLMPL